MKKLFIMLACAASVLCFASAGSAKKMFVLNVDKGEMPDDYSDGVSPTLSEENSAVKDGFSLKMAFTKPAFCGLFRPKKATWGGGFKNLCFNLYNAEDKDVVMAFSVKNDKSESDRKTWCVFNFTAKPGMNEFKLPLTGAKTQAGKDFAIDKIAQWDFTWKFFPENAWEEKNKSDELTVYVSNLRLED